MYERNSNIETNSNTTKFIDSNNNSDFNTDLLSINQSTKKSELGVKIPISNVPNMDPNASAITFESISIFIILIIPERTAKMQTAIDILKQERLAILGSIYSIVPNTEYEKIKKNCETVIDLTKAIEALECAKLEEF